MSDERIERIRKELDNNYGVHSVPPNPMEGARAFPNARGHVRYLLDYIAALEAVRDAARAVTVVAHYTARDYKNLLLNTAELTEVEEDVEQAEELIAMTRKLIDALAAAGQGENEESPASESQRGGQGGEPGDVR